MTYIISEVGSNWTNLSDCLESISASKACGADAVKFQAFDSRSLYGIRSNPIAYELPLEWLPALKEKADACGIDFMCTAFSPYLLQMVNPFVTAHKIASSNLTDPILLAAAQRTGKHVYLSCGASSMGDVTRAASEFRDKLTLLYCVSAYPSRYHNLFMMEDLKKLGFPVGYSDHTTDIVYSPLSAVKHFGATVLEKHVTFIEADTPDRPHSLTRDEFKFMVDVIRGKRSIEYNPQPEELDMFLRHNVRLIATKDLTAGSILVFGENFGIHRSLKDDYDGYSGFAWSHFDGQTLKVDIAAGQGLSQRFVF
jgi:N,N'-diacetyllegionaminate synthase